MNLRGLGAAAATAVLLTGALAGCGVETVEASQPAGGSQPVATTPAASPASTNTARTAATFRIAAVQSGELGRVTRQHTTHTTLDGTDLVAGKVYRLVAACVDGASGRLTVALHDARNRAQRGADPTASANTFQVRCDGAEHPVDFQVATPTRADLRLVGTRSGTRAYAYVLDAGRNGVCGCS